MTEMPDWAIGLSGSPGDPTAFRFAIRSVTFASGATTPFAEAGVTAIVGANNSGKSTLLRQLQAHLISPLNLGSEPARIIESVQIDYGGNGLDFVAWLAQHATYRSISLTPGDGQFSRPGTSGVYPQRAQTAWDTRNPNEFGQLSAFLSHYADAQGRLGQVGGVQQRDDAGQAPSHPLHELQDDSALRDRIFSYSEAIFRQPLVLDDLSGTMRLRVGTPGVPAPKFGESQAQFREALSKLPGLERQGDGMRSLLGLLLPIATATYPIILVDEPEAFLHPPQALALGRALGELAQTSRVQIILATHDRNILAGLLAAEVDLAVIRLTRAGDTTEAASLSAEDLRALWTDPVLRYSNILDGLFHQLVVLAEGDQDCRFYTAAVDSGDRLARLPIAPTDILFVPSHGKAALANLAEALRAVAVPVVASPDLDILNDESVLKRLVNALGHDWDRGLAQNYKEATEAFRQPRDRMRVSDVRVGVDHVFDDILSADQDATYGPETRDKVSAALRTHESPWRSLKLYGDRAFRDRAAGARLLEALDRKGVIAVRVGELEGFAPELGVSKGRGWLSAALLDGAHEGTAAQAHVRRLLFATPVRTTS